MIELKNINNEKIVTIMFEGDCGNNVSSNENCLDNENKNEDFSFKFCNNELKILDEWKKGSSFRKVFIEMKNNEEPYSSLLGARIFEITKELKRQGFDVDFSRLKQDVRDIISIAFKDTGNKAPQVLENKKEWLEQIGESTFLRYLLIVKCLKFIGASLRAVFSFVGVTAIYRKKDFLMVFSQCSYEAVPIISLVSFLVGLIIAFVGAIQLQSFGAEIYVASMVSIGMTRIMAAIMVGIVMAGRTGSSFAATIGTMQVNEEIDALKTLGININQYLVMPRVISLVVSIPFLTILADILGILGGGVVGIFFLNIASITYLNYSISALSLNNILIGLFHSLVYGVIIAITGAYQGINVGRDADSVGGATTKAVVYSLVWMIVATGIITILLEVLGL